MAGSIALSVEAASVSVAERADEAPAYASWFRERGFEVFEPKHTNEGEGDILLAGDVLLAGTGFRTAHASHAETQETLRRPVISSLATAGTNSSCFWSLLSFAKYASIDATDTRRTPRTPPGPGIKTDLILPSLSH